MHSGDWRRRVNIKSLARGGRGNPAAVLEQRSCRTARYSFRRDSPSRPPLSCQPPQIIFADSITNDNSYVLNGNLFRDYFNIEEWPKNFLVYNLIILWQYTEFVYSHDKQIKINARCWLERAVISLSLSHGFPCKPQNPKCSYISSHNCTPRIV